VAEALGELAVSAVSAGGRWREPLELFGRVLDEDDLRRGGTGGRLDDEEALTVGGYVIHRAGNAPQVTYRSSTTFSGLPALHTLARMSTRTAMIAPPGGHIEQLRIESALRRAP